MENEIQKINYPLLGVAYYPEDWDESEQDKDIANMQKAGITVARMGEFAWRKMEPKDGEFHFEWLHKVVDKLAAAGIRSVLGTPSATPPIWLEEKEPSIMTLGESGRRAQHGGRRNVCSNNPAYQKYSLRIAEKMAQEFGNDPNVIGWQIDNEIYPYDPPVGEACFCEHCQKAFVQHLRERYGSIEEVNRRWDLNLFSQAYDTFEQVPMPKSYIWHNPHLKYEWALFRADSHIRFVKMQTEVIHRYSKAPVGTDMMPMFGMDYAKVAKFVDIMQINHYHDEHQLNSLAFWFDYMRTFKDIPFWSTETATCWNGAHVATPNLRPEGYCRANSWLPIILGGAANMYWLWRQHWAGHELMHGAVMYASGRPMHIFGEVQEVARGFAAASDFLSATRVQSNVAVMVSANSDRLFQFQQITDDGDDTAGRLFRMYRYITDAKIRPDVISPDKDLTKYKLLFTPYMMTLEEEDLPNRIEKWVRDGGVWVVGPMTDIRNDVGAHYTDRETGMLERFTNTELVQQIPDHKHLVSCAWSDGTEYRACHWLQLFDVDDETESMVKVTDGFSTLVGKTLVFRKKIGKGEVIVIGALPEQEDAARLLGTAIADSGAETLKFTGNLVAAYREGDGVCGISAQEIGNQPATLYFDGSMTDLLTGKVYTGAAEFAPYQTMILKK